MATRTQRPVEAAGVELRAASLTAERLAVLKDLNADKIGSMTLAELEDMFGELRAIIGDLTAAAFAVGRREDPMFTLRDAGNMRLADLRFQFEQTATAD